MRRQLSSLVAFVFAVGCAATGPLFTDAPPPSPGHALVYVYRMPDAAISARDARFYVDDKPVFRLSTDGYSYFAVPAGHHQLSQEWPYDVAWGKTLKVPLSITAGETRFFRFDVDLSAAGPLLQAHWKLVEVKAEEARREIADKHFQPPDDESD